MSEKISEADLTLIAEIIRLPKNSSFVIMEGSMEAAFAKAKLADLNIFSLNAGTSLTQMAEIAQRTRISALFCADSGFENAFV